MKLIAASVVLVLAIGLPGSPQTSAQSSELDSIVEAIDRNFAKMTNLSADFLQNSGGQSRSNLGQMRQDQGRLYLGRERKMRFDYAVPEARSYISDGKTLWCYDPAERMFGEEKVKESAADMLPLVYLVGQSGLRKNFKFTALPKEPLFQGDRVLQLEPVRKNENIKDIQIEVDPRRRLIIRMTLADTAGVVNDFILSKIEINSAEIKDSKFEFEPPPGARRKKGACVQ